MSGQGDRKLAAPEMLPSPALILQHSSLILTILTFECRWSTFQRHFFSIQA